MSPREIDPRLVESSYDRIALDYHRSRLAKTAENIAFLDRYAEVEEAGFEIVWRDIDRRPGDDDHLFVLARRSG